MRHSKLLIPTLREEPADADSISYRLLVRAGFIRKLSSGIYSYLPMGFRVLSKIEKVVREEMNCLGAQEVRLPTLQPSELWQETGRWQQYGKELMRLSDRHNRSFCLGPTHEEVVTDLARNMVRSYRDLPITLYQIQTKFRDEIRPRFGLMRGREFVMKDAYSFDADCAGAEERYRGMYDAYHKIFSRCGLRFRAVEADTGLIGGSSSHEFMVLAEVGEEAIASCLACSYAANVERAEGKAKQYFSIEELHSLEKVATPGAKSIEEVAAFLKVPSSQLIKTLLFRADGRLVAALVRGNHVVNEIKLKCLLNVSELVLADSAEIEKWTGGPAGYSGPIGLTGIEVIADFSVESAVDCVVGANERDRHYLHASVGRDFTVDRFADIRNMVAGDSCPSCGKPVVIHRGIEVGHVFMLGEKYSQKMKATFLNASGAEQFFVMGCYGIGVSRIMAACIEQNYDEKGMVWPTEVAPFAVHLIPLQDKKEKVVSTAETLYRSLTDAGVETLLDDRQERAGIKFNDADLIGIPYQVIIGEKNLMNGMVELKDRKTDTREKIPTEAVVPRLAQRLLRG